MNIWEKRDLKLEKRRLENIRNGTGHPVWTTKENKRRKCHGIHS